MKNSEILRRYKREVNTDSYEEIHKKYRSESNSIKSANEVEDKLSTPLLIIIILLIIAGAATIPMDLPEAFYIILPLVIILVIWRKIYRKVIDKKERQAYKNRMYSTELFDLRQKYLFDYNSVIGYFDELYSSTGMCGDYDENREISTCSVTGQPIDYLEYSYQCQRQGKCCYCPKFESFINHLYD